MAAEQPPAEAPGAVDEAARAAYADGRYEDALATWERLHQRGVAAETTPWPLTARRW